MIMRRPRAPILRSSAISAIASSASSVKRSLTFSYSNSFWYCRVMALRGWVRIWTSAGLSSSCSVPMTGRRPTNSGISPNLIRSCGSICSRTTPTSRALLRLDVGLEAQRLLADAPLDDLLEADERAAADEQDVGRVDLEELLVRVLAAALRRHVGHRAFQDLQQRLLHALARHVAGDRRVLVLAADLVDLVDVDDALLALLDVAAGRLQQLEDDVLDVLADVAGFGQRRRVDDGERHREELGQRLREQRLAGAGRTDQQDVRLGELDVVAAARLLLDLEPLVVVVDRDRQLLLGELLADDVLVEELLDLVRRRQRRARRRGLSNRLSSAMMSLQTSTHSSQMKTVGPAMSFLTSF